jgi:hypothetical protein
VGWSGFGGLRSGRRVGPQLTILSEFALSAITEVTKLNAVSSPTIDKILIFMVKDLLGFQILQAIRLTDEGNKSSTSYF